MMGFTSYNHAIGSSIFCLSLNVIFTLFVLCIYIVKKTKKNRTELKSKKKKKVILGLIVIPPIFS